MESLLANKIQEAVLEGLRPAKEISKELNKPYPTLMRELNPNDTGAKLGLFTFIDLLRATNNYEPLRQMAEEMGYLLVPASQVTEEGKLALSDRSVSLLLGGTLREKLPGRKTRRRRTG